MAILLGHMILKVLGFLFFTLASIVEGSGTVHAFSCDTFMGSNFHYLDLPTCHSSFPLFDKEVSGTVGPSTDVTNSFMKLVVGLSVLETPV